MEPQKKREEFMVSIRRKSVNQTMSAIRSMIQIQNIPQSQVFKNYQSIIQNVLEKPELIENKINDLKILSWQE